MAQTKGEDALERHRHTVGAEQRIGVRTQAPRLDVRERKGA
jgi:hypothetical protein